MKNMRKRHGIYPIISLFNVFQLPVHMVYISMINKLAYNFNINPAILTDGMLWFKDLSSPDPYGILPIIAGGLSLLNIMTSSASRGNSSFRKISKYMKLMPLLTIPIWMTFPAAFNLYWIVSSFIQLITLNLFRFAKFRKAINLPDFLPGSKLEKMNVKFKSEVIKPKIFSAPQI